MGDGVIDPLTLKFVLGGGEWSAALFLGKKPRYPLNTTHGGLQNQKVCLLSGLGA